MYNPAHFQEHDTEGVHALMDAYPFASLVVQTSKGLLANHFPLLRAPNGDLIGHVAKANELHHLASPGQEVLAIFRGLDGYVSPNYYPSKAEHHRQVPTWNYLVVHVHGTIAFQHDEPSKRSAVALLTRVHERRVNGDKAWKMADAPADYLETMLANIVAFRITTTKVEAKSKLSQNREARDHAGAIEGLRAAGSGALAVEMAKRSE
jgi:transcriptional regulator